MSVNVNLKGSIDGNDSELADDRRVIGDFLRTQHDPRAKIIEVVVDFLELGLGQGESGRTGAGESPGAHEIDTRVLENLGVYRKRRQVGMLAQTRQQCVADVSHSALQRQKLARQTARSQLLQKEANKVLGDLLAHGIGLAWRLTRARLIRFDDGYNLGGIDHGVRNTDPVKRVSDGDGLAMRRQRKDEDVAEFPDARRVMPVDLDHDLLGQLQVGRAIADGRREGDTSIIRDVAGFDHGKIDLAEESLEKLL